LTLVDLFLFGAALVGGALNAVAGGGSFLALPALLYAGIAPVSANATTTLAMWPGSVASAVAYRDHFMTSRTRLLLLLSISVVGGVLGGLLLVGTSDTSFMRLLPWLMLTATVTFTFGGQVQARLRRVRVRAAAARQAFSSARRGEVGRDSPAHTIPAPGTRSAFPVLPLLIQLAIAVYGGYFGGGAGIMMLAMLSIAGLTDIHEMNGLKSLLAVAINGVALAAFIYYGVVDWSHGLVMVAGAILGGYAGATLARRVDQKYVRWFVIVVGWTMTAYFFVA
jgi:uncharacterized membrane protein YfcA